MFLIRRLHKWFGLVLGLQMLLWAASGAVMALLDHHTVSGEHSMLPAPQPTVSPTPVSLTEMAARVNAPVLKVKLKPLYDGWAYEVATPAGVRLVDAITGEPVAIDAGRARTLAVARYAGDAPVSSVSRVAEPTLETRGIALPVWRVAFADPEHTTFLISEPTGELLAARNDTWRIWDVAWMLHIMDYTERKSFNHPLIVTVATGVLWLALSGVILLFRSFRRSDVAWIADGVEALGARRRQAASKATR